MYLPKTKYKAAAAKAGSFIDKLNGNQYTGPVIQDFLGRFFKGKTPSDNGGELEYQDSVDSPQGETMFVSKFPKPAADNYAKGVFPRYFCKDSRTNKIIELDTDGYKKFKSESKLYRRTLRIEWYVTGNPEDQIINGYLYPGTKTKNQDVINQAEEILPGIGKQILKDPGQFVK
jgi:hypothetical protein